MNSNIVQNAYLEKILPESRIILLTFASLSMYSVINEVRDEEVIACFLWERKQSASIFMIYKEVAYEKDRSNHQTGKTGSRQERA